MPDSALPAKPGDTANGIPRLAIPAQRTPPDAVLLLACPACETVREHPRGTPLRSECPACGGWLVTAALGEPGGAR